MKQRELFEQIEAYLNQSLPPEQMQAWEQRLADDPDLRREVELHQQLQKDYDSGRIQLRANLHNIMNEPLPPDPALESGGKFRWGLWLGLLVVAAVFGWGIWKGQSPAPVVPNMNDPVLPKVPDVAPLALPPDTTPVSPNPSKPMAMTDPARFKPNQGMEAFVNGSVRSESIEITMRHPANNTRFMPDDNGAFQVRFAGSFPWTKEEQNPKMVLLFFDNVNTSKPLRTAQVPTQQGVVGTLTFDMRQRLTFPSGLYYFTLEEEDKGEVLYAGKFLVGK